MKSGPSLRPCCCLGSLSGSSCSLAVIQKPCSFLSWVYWVMGCFHRLNDPRMPGIMEKWPAPRWPFSPLACHRRCQTSELPGFYPFRKWVKPKIFFVSSLTIISSSFALTVCTPVSPTGPVRSWNTEPLWLSLCPTAPRKCIIVLNSQSRSVEWNSVFRYSFDSSPFSNLLATFPKRPQT